MTPESDLEQLAGWLREARFVTVLTGAGISTESGIPDFRGPQGVWTRDPEAEKRANLQYYLANPDARKNSWRSRLDSPLAKAQPNAGHLALVDLERKGKLHALITQNIDGLHHAAGNSPAIIVEVHGNVREFRCMSCTDRGPIERVLDRVRGGEEDPPCRSCGGILKSATISFGQNLEREDIERSEMAAASSDVFLAVGTSLAVYPVALTPEIALRSGAKLAILNAEETPFDRVAHAVIRERLGEALPRLVAMV
jgi:NAD-dependent deacetylase